MRERIDQGGPADQRPEGAGREALHERSGDSVDHSSAHRPVSPCRYLAAQAVQVASSTSSISWKSSFAR